MVRPKKLMKEKLMENDLKKSDLKRMASPFAREYIEQLEEALKFYAAQEHWMQISEGSETSTVLCALHKSGDVNGWSVAQDALN